MSELYSLHKITVQAAEEPLHAVIADNIDGLSKQKARQAIVAGLVQIDGLPETQPTKKMPDSQVTIQIDLRQGIKQAKQQKRNANERSFDILFQDDDVVVVNKAAGVLSAPSQKDDHGHIPELLRQYWRKQKKHVPYIGVVHRIDQATSGCLIFALNKHAQNILSQQFQQHVAERRYKCLCQGQPLKDRDTLAGKIGRGHDGRRRAMRDEDIGKSAITHFEVEQRFKNNCSEINLRLETGRTHQIRVHLAGIGCPIIGDEVYNKGRKRSKDDPGVAPMRAPRLMLHAYRLAFDHPRTGKRMSIEAELPEIYTRYQKKLQAAK